MIIKKINGTLDPDPYQPKMLDPDSYSALKKSWIRIGIQPKMLDPVSYST
jgi:hypothetical protein